MRESLVETKKAKGHNILELNSQQIAVETMFNNA